MRALAEYEKLAWERSAFVKFVTQKPLFLLKF